MQPSSRRVPGAESTIQPVVKVSGGGAGSGGEGGTSATSRQSASGVMVADVLILPVELQLR